LVNELIGAHRNYMYIQQQLPCHTFVYLLHVVDLDLIFRLDMQWH